MYLKNGGETSGNAATVNLLLNGGSVNFHGGFAPNGPAVGGTLQVLANSVITTDQTDAQCRRPSRLQSSISGSANLTVNMNSTGNGLILSGNNSAYTGNWTNVWHCSAVCKNFEAPTTNALGSGSVRLANPGAGLIFDSTHDLIVNNSVIGPRVS